MDKFKKLLIMLLTGLIIGLQAPAALAYEDGDDVAIMLDLAILRPLGLVATMTGTAIFIASLPISIGTWSMGKTFGALVAKPLSYTFVRDLGDPR